MEKADLYNGRAAEESKQVKQKLGKSDRKRGRRKKDSMQYDRKTGEKRYPCYINTAIKHYTEFHQKRMYCSQLPVL